jgi:hypothetical protein
MAHAKSGSLSLFFWSGGVWTGPAGAVKTSPLGGLGWFGDGLTGISWSVRGDGTNRRGGKGGVVRERRQIGGREGGAPQL